MWSATCFDRPGLLSSNGNGKGTGAGGQKGSENNERELHY
jgi:hypothetical protein